MRNIVATLFMSVVVASNAFASTLIVCDGNGGSKMVFSESSFSGKPLLKFSSHQLTTEFTDSISVNKSVDGSTDVSARRGSHFGFSTSVHFTLPNTNLFDQPFDIKLEFFKETGREPIIAGDLSMRCIAKNVVF